MRLEDYVAHVEKGEVPPEPPYVLTLHGQGGSGTEYYEARETCIKHGMWSVVDLRWTKMLAEWIGDRRVLEIMSGPGWLAKALETHGVDIVATDNGSWSERHSKAVPIYAVLPMDAKEAVEEFGPERDVLLVSWPPCDETDVCGAAAAWGDKPMIYVGEGAGGCNAPNEFWRCFRGMEDAPEFPMASWYGKHDHVQIGTYEKEG